MERKRLILGPLPQSSSLKPNYSQATVIESSEMEENQDEILDDDSFRTD